MNPVSSYVINFVFLYREAATAAQKAYERMNEPDHSGYQPTTSFTYSPEGLPGTSDNDVLRFVEPDD